MNKLKLLSTGKAKSLYTTDDNDKMILTFRDDISAFNAEKLDQLAGKGNINNAINTFIMQYLAEQGIQTHFIEQLNATECVVQSLKMLPLEAVVRNRAAGSLCKRYGIEKGRRLQPPLFEFYLKDDALGDPILRDEHILSFNFASEADIQAIKALSLKINEILLPLFEQAGMWLVDFKLEFGRNSAGDLVLGDEFSPDGCRIWDAHTQEILDKDRFRQDLGEVVAHYQQVAKRLGVQVV